MGLNTRVRECGRGCGHGAIGNFPPETRHGRGKMGQRPFFRRDQPGMVCPPVGFSAEPPFGNLQIVERPAGFSSRTLEPGFGKFPGKHFSKYATRKKETHTPEIDLTKPWVTEEIKNEDTKKQEIFELWKKTKSVENWAEYEAQKLTVQALFDKAREEYTASHPNEAVHRDNASSVKRYFCETCDKSFKTGDDFLLHNAEHERCGREGCEFTAHPKIIAKHIKMQHETGLYKRIGKLYTDEDIMKWIEERKRRYPTRKVVEEKKILEQEKLNRGERIKEDNSKFNKSFNNRGRSMRKKIFEKRTLNNSRTRRIRKKKNVSLVERCLKEEISVIRKGVPAFLGINTVGEPGVSEKNDLNISDEEWETESKPQIITKPLLNSSLGLLAMSYDSDGENEKETPMETKTESISADEGSGPEEASSKNPLPDEKLNEEKISHKRKFSDRRDGQKRERKNTSDDSYCEKKNLTLLEKLLKNEIRHERNIILQCTHYVVKNNFFKT